MPMYQLRSRTADGRIASEDLGFYHDDAALGHATRMVRSDSIEIWRDGRLIGTVEPQIASQPAPALAD